MEGRLRTHRLWSADETWERLLQQVQAWHLLGRARQAVVAMRSLLSPYRHRGIPAVTALDARAAPSLPTYIDQVTMRHEGKLMAQSLEIKPIGIVVGGRTEPTDDHWGGPAIIRLDPTFPADVVNGLEDFSHLVVVWHFHKASPADVALHARRPRNNPAWPPTGTFVHRNHRRPNQLAQSFPRLVKVEGLDLHVVDLDAVEGTPLYDVAPYFRAMGPRGEVREPSWPTEMLADYWE